MLHFKTKIECETAVRAKIYEIGICDDVKDELLITYTKQHCIWSGQVIKLGIEPDDINLHYLRCYFLYLNGDKRVFSWKTILQPKTFNFKISQSYRNSIYPYIINFRNNNSILQCEICKNNCNLQIDHIYEFKNIIKDFETKYDVIWNKTIDYFEKTEINHIKFKDNNFNNKFIDYHNTFINNYRVLCRTCNTKRNIKMI